MFPVQFYNEFPARCAEVYNEIADGVLTPEIYACELMVS